MNECEIVGCWHYTTSIHTILCKEHEIDLTYWQASQEEFSGNTSLRTYVHLKNRELLG